MKKLKIIELFGGIGSIRKALINLEIPYQVIDYVEIDKNCVKSYNSLYKENYKEKSVIDYKLPKEKIDILMHGSPCQDFSQAGKKLGGKKGSGTRSSLLFETIKIIQQAKYKPKIVIWENVKAVLHKHNKTTLDDYLNEMEKLGYKNKYKVLNALDFGVAQKRERLFVISILNNNLFNFNNLETKKREHIKNYLETNAHTRYIVTQKSFLEQLQGKRKNTRVRIIKDTANTITTKQMRLPNAGLIKLENGKYRYLTELECTRLMGFSDEDYNTLIKTHKRKKENFHSGIIYKQLGNSVVVVVLESIIKEITKEK